ncbi:hypothetical protein DPMN_020222 [Dreissena polymorpha]|uniref:Uncharacterized protein n=1 Tax=Dreissena polymorpha TaxID=45954 RepID=A0A9D4NLS2_DREPO|nr:hypothetical protein DPMN_020222 [Dreissena polymorpha]
MFWQPRLTHTSQSKSVGFDVAAHQLKEIHARSALTTVPYHDVLQLAPILTLVSVKNSRSHGPWWSLQDWHVGLE